MTQYSPQENARLIWDYVLRERPNPEYRLELYASVLQRYVTIVPPDSDSPDHISLMHDWDRMTHDTYATLTINSEGVPAYEQHTFRNEGEQSDGSRETKIDFDADHPTTHSELNFLATRIRNASKM